jgi:hypothetical protein
MGHTKTFGPPLLPKVNLQTLAVHYLSGELDWIDYANVGKLRYWETNGQTYEEWVNTPQNKAGLRRMTLD